MFSNTHPLLPIITVVESTDDSRIVFHTFDEVVAMTPASDRAIIDNFLAEPDVSPTFADVFRGELCYQNASETQRASMHAILAGVTDGDGCFTGSDRSGSSKVNFSIHQHAKDLQLVYLFLYWFRIGSVNSYPGCKSNGVDHSMRRWCVHTAKSVWIASKLEPFLLLKRRQAKEFLTMPCVTRAKSTFAVAVSAAQKHSTLPQALGALGAPADVTVDLEELGRAKYFVDESGLVKLVRKVCTSYQTVQAAPVDIRVFESCVVAAERCGATQSKVPKTSNGKCFQSAGYVFWANDSRDTDATRQQCVEVLNTVHKMNWTDDDVIPDDVAPSREYMAGFFAAEGSLSPRNKTGAIIALSQKYRPICDLYARMYGSHTYLNEIATRGMYYLWSISDINRVQGIFDEWKPFLIAKLRDFNSVLTTVGMPEEDRKQHTHRARERHLPESMKTERRNRKRQVGEIAELKKRFKADV